MFSLQCAFWWRDADRKYILYRVDSLQYCVWPDITTASCPIDDGGRANGLDVYFVQSATSGICDDAPFPC